MVVVALAVGAVISAGPAVASERTAGTARDPVDGRIVYDDGATGQLYTINPDGTVVVQLTHIRGGQAAAIEPVWTPDASHVVFVSNSGGGDFRLFAIRRNGTRMRQVVREPAGFNDFTPAVSPDGRTIVYARCRPEPRRGCALFAVQFDGKHERALTRYGTGGHRRSDFWPDVSPDGSRIAFQRSDGNADATRIWVMHFDGTHAHPITAPRLAAGVPRWSPHGDQLYVTSNFRHGAADIYRIRADGTHVRRLTRARFPHNNQFAVPAPSGDRLAFSSDRAYRQPLADGDLFVMRRDGRRQDRIATGQIRASDWGTAPLLVPHVSRLAL